MKKISGNKLLVKALKEEGVDTIFGYPGACTIDLSDELYKQDYTKVILPRQEIALVHEADAYRERCVPGSGYRRHYKEHYKIRRPCEEQGGSRKDRQRGFLYCQDRKAWAGAYRSPERCDGRAWKRGVPGRGQYPRIPAEYTGTRRTA